MNHLWAIAEGARRDMIQNTKDQAISITNAGKTENTKKVITYWAIVKPNETMNDSYDRLNLL